MNQEQVFKEITKNKKWYIGFYTQQTASAIVKRYKNKTLSHEKIIEIFGRFGYIKITEDWCKSQSV